MEAESGFFFGVSRKDSTSNYAAATRWQRPARDGRSDDAQSWNVELLHGHGGRLGSTVLLEVDRETGDVRASALLAESTGCVVAGPSYGVKPLVLVETTASR